MSRKNDRLSLLDAGFLDATEHQNNKRPSGNERGPILGELSPTLEYIPPVLPNVVIYKSEEHIFPPISEQYKRDKAARRKSAMIDQQLKEDAKKINPENHLTLLMLGPGDSGKTTVLKQMKLLHGDGFTENDKQQALLDIHSGIVRNARILIQGLSAGGVVFTGYPDTNALLTTVRDYNHVLGERIPHEMGQAIAKLYKEKMIQLFLKKESLPFEDSGIHFLEKAEVYTDILLCRRKTEHISETVFEIDQKFWHIVDVAGQADKRARWATYFEKNLSALLYVFSTASYSQLMEEDGITNRLHDAINLYKQLLGNPVLKVPAVMVFMNKVDLLNERIKVHPIKQYLPQYSGENDKKSYLNYLNDLFKLEADNFKVTSYIYCTQATDKSAMKKVIASVKYQY
ncbi:guanine nucleotide binding protein, alpha subunit [Gorgonomyces haynaldii]|nr:guanine nucleotide binding protein, alpha subunit [Gorgonomyces haynaldii]